MKAGVIYGKNSLTCPSKYLTGASEDNFYIRNTVAIESSLNGYTRNYIVQMHSVTVIVSNFYRGYEFKEKGNTMPHKQISGIAAFITN